MQNCSNDQFTCNNSQCIALNLLCDSQADCEDGSDESFSCSKSTLLLNDNDTIFLGPTSNNSKGCAVENGGCDQLCNVTHNNTSYCSCHEGYRLSSDGKTCTGKSG